MKKLQPALFFRRLYSKKEHFPFGGQIEITYRCNLNCIHCYCEGSESESKELTTKEWKSIIDAIQAEGCIALTITGGDPLVRTDFLELYSYAKLKGFLINVFTNGLGLTDEIIDYFVKAPPASIEITLNGITQKTYESITGVPGSFSQVIRNIKALGQKKLPLVLKSNCLKQNKHEIAQVKAFTQELFGNLARNKYRFKYDPMIYPRLNGDKTPLDYRLSFAELMEAIEQDPDIWKQYQEGLHRDLPSLKIKKEMLYRCNAWLEGFFIDPYGRLKFCHFSDKFSVDLKATSFREGFYGVFPQLLKKTFKTNSKCKDCHLRPICYHCPARAYLETGDEEAPVAYFCELAKATYQLKKT